MRTSSKAKMSASMLTRPEVRAWLDYMRVELAHSKTEEVRPILRRPIKQTITLITITPPQLNYTISRKSVCSTTRMKVQTTVVILNLPLIFSVQAIKRPPTTPK
jgi:hypothetical protein